MLDNLTTSDEILGKEVLDIHGRVLGIIQKMHVDRRLKKIVGLTIDEGFMRPQLYVGIANVRFFGIDAVMLNMEVESYEGRKIFSNSGVLMGTVKQVIKNPTGTVKEIIIKGHDGVFSVDASRIKSMGENVVLKY